MKEGWRLEVHKLDGKNENLLMKGSFTPSPLNANEHFFAGVFSTKYLQVSNAVFSLLYSIDFGTR